MEWGLYMAGQDQTKVMTNLWPEPRPRQGRVLNAYTSLTDFNIKTAAQLWVSNQASATTTYGPVHLWDLSQVTSLANVWCGSDASSCGSAYVAMRSFNGDISMWDVSKVTTMYFTFLQASAFNGDTSKWNAASVANVLSTHPMPSSSAPEPRGLAADVQVPPTPHRAAPRFAVSYACKKREASRLFG